MNTLLKKANKKYHALARVCNYMDTKKRRVLMKAFITSQFSNCPLVWMFHSRTLNNRINKIHERALRLGHRKLRIWSHLLRKSLMESFVFCAVLFGNDLTKHVKDLTITNKLERSKSYCQSNYSNKNSKKICKILL